MIACAAAVRLVPGLVLCALGLSAAVPPPPGQMADPFLKVTATDGPCLPAVDKTTGVRYRISPCEDPLGNALGLFESADGRDWKLKTIALRHEDRRFSFVPLACAIDDSGWGYLVFACRTAWTNGCERQSWITYHRLARFREMDRTSDALAYQLYDREPEKYVGWKPCAFNIDTAFPGGYVNVESMRGNTVRFNVNPEEPLYSQLATHCRLRNFINWSGSYHFAFRVRNAEGRRLHFEITRGQPLGWLGPCVSRDGGRTWTYLYRKASHANMRGFFDVDFGADDHEVIIAGRPLYTDCHLQRFLAKADPDGTRIERGVFATSPHGRPARCLRFGPADARYACVLTARHHTPEVEASFVLEGIITEAIGGSGPEAGYLAKNVEFFIVPFMSTDGVEEGEDNVRCRPHNYNRDYIKERYPEIRGFKASAPGWIAGRPFVFSDFHTLSSVGSFVIPIVQEKKEDFLRKSGCFMPSLHDLQKAVGGIPVETGRITAEYRGSDFKSAQELSWGWMAALPGCLFSMSLECPSAIAIGWEDARGRRVDWWKYLDQVGKDAVEMNPENIRVLGRNFAKALALFYMEREK